MILWQRANQRKVIIWHTIDSRFTAEDVDGRWDGRYRYAIDDGYWTNVRIWHIWCGSCMFSQCCNPTTTYYTSQEARAAMAKHWAEAHS